LFTSVPMILNHPIQWNSGAVWELTAGLLKKGINPDKLSHPAMAAELTNPLVPGVVLARGIVGTIPQFRLAGSRYAK
jgi:hypothetical protein